MQMRALASATRSKTKELAPELGVYALFKKVYFIPFSGLEIKSFSILYSLLLCVYGKPKNRSLKSGNGSSLKSGAVVSSFTNGATDYICPLVLRK
jgi:hypothetical protein